MGHCGARMRAKMHTYSTTRYYFKDQQETSRPQLSYHARDLGQGTGSHRGQDSQASQLLWAAASSFPRLTSTACSKVASQSSTFARCASAASALRSARARARMLARLERIPAGRGVFASEVDVDGMSDAGYDDGDKAE